MVYSECCSYRWVLFSARLVYIDWRLRCVLCLTRTVRHAAWCKRYHYGETRRNLFPVYRIFCLTVFVVLFRHLYKLRVLSSKPFPVHRPLVVLPLTVHQTLIKFLLTDHRRRIIPRLADHDQVIIIRLTYHSLIIRRFTDYHVLVILPLTAYRALITLLLTYHRTRITLHSYWVSHYSHYDWHIMH